MGRTEEQDEELGTLIAVDDNELDYMTLRNLLKVKIDNPNIVDSISTDFDEIIERLNRLGKKLSIESHTHSYVTGLQRLKFAFESAGMINFVIIYLLKKKKII